MDEHTFIILCKSIVRPHVEFANSVRCPFKLDDIKYIEKIQKMATKLVSSFVETKKIFPSNDPFPLKYWLHVTYPLLIAASLDTFCLVAPQR